MQWIVRTICINVPRTTGLDPSCTNYVQRSSRWFPRLAPFVGFGWISRKSSAILFHCSNKPPAHSFLSLTPLPTGNAREECKALQRLHSCAHTAASLLLCNSIHGLTCKSSGTDFCVCFFWWQGQVVYKWKWTQEREYGIDSLLQLPVTENTVRDLPGSVAFLNSMVHKAIKLPCTYSCCSSLPSTLGGLAKNYLSKKSGQPSVLLSHFPSVLQSHPL